MKKLFTAICCIGMAITGYFITEGSRGTSDASYNALHAATIPYKNYGGQLPRDLVLDLAQKIKQDTVVIHDTVTVTNTKYVRIPVPGHATDTIYVPLSELQEIECTSSVKNKSPGDREEQSLDEDHTPNGVVILTIDGKIVYSSKNDIHSGGSPRDSMSVSDGRLTP